MSTPPPPSGGLDLTALVSGLLVLAGGVVTALVQYVLKRMSRRGEDAKARLDEVDAAVKAGQARELQVDKGLERMRGSVDFAFGMVDRVKVQLEQYEEQMRVERAQHEARVEAIGQQAGRRMDEFQTLADQRHQWVLDEVQQLRGELLGTRDRIRAHEPWDRRVSKLVREHLDPDLPDPPEL